MKRLLIIIMLVLASLICIAQEQVDVQKNEHVLFGYVECENEFEDVLPFLERCGIKVKTYCEEEGLIFIELTNKKFKDYTEIFEAIERKFGGECHFKSNADIIMQYDKCYDIYIKQKE